MSLGKRIERIERQVVGVRVGEQDRVELGQRVERDSRER